MKKNISIVTIAILLSLLCSCGLFRPAGTINIPESPEPAGIVTGTREAEAAGTTDTTPLPVSESAPEETVTVTVSGRESERGTTEQSSSAAADDSTTANAPTARQTEKITAEVITTAAAKEKESAGKDSQTEKITETVPAPESNEARDEPETISCTFGISCETILDNRKKLKENKAAFLPENGMIIDDIKITVPAGSTVFDVIKKVCAESVCTNNCRFCQKNGIQLDYIYTPGYDNYYIRGVHQIYEKDCGSRSGWMYSVNGVFPGCGCSQYIIENDDEIMFLYTCDMGIDLGADF